jgi:hypothetical protein
MKRYAAIVVAMISLNAWGVDTAPNQQKTSVGAKQDSDKKKALNSFLSGGPRSTKIVRPDGEQKKGVDGFLNGLPRSTKIVRPGEAKR